MTSDPRSFGAVVSTTARLLTFRATRDQLIHLNNRHLLFGLLCTWIVGIGRYWDNPRVGLLQHLGIGSVIYIFVLALLLWLIIWPLRPEGWNYLRVLTFISLVSPPALLYAIPLQYFTSIDTANTVNTIFLAVIATWRVALLIFLLSRLGRLDPFSIIVGSILPLTLVVVTLAILNLERVVFDVMRGFIEPSINDQSYGVLVVLTYISFFAFIPLLIVYVGIVIIRNLRLRGKTEKL
jgi:hypothetical protein